MQSEKSASHRQDAKILQKAVRGRAVYLTGKDEPPRARGRIRARDTYQAAADAIRQNLPDRE